MAAPKRWFETNQFNVAKKIATKFDWDLFRFKKTTRAGVVKGIYIGPDLPAQLQKPCITIEK
jgi:hypothetical protein